MSKVKKEWVVQNGVWIVKSQGKDLKNPDYILDKLKCSQHNSKSVVEYDKLTDNKTASEKFLAEYDGTVFVPKAPKPKKVGIVENDLVFLLDIIKANFKVGQGFKNADCAKLQNRFTARQTPSRLKKLVEQGSLKSEGTPKTYYLI